MCSVYLMCASVSAFNILLHLYHWDSELSQRRWNCWSQRTRTSILSYKHNSEFEMEVLLKRLFLWFTNRYNVDVSIRFFLYFFFCQSQTENFCVPFQETKSNYKENELPESPSSFLFFFSKPIESIWHVLCSVEYLCECRYNIRESHHSDTFRRSISGEEWIEMAKIQ